MRNLTLTLLLIGLFNFAFTSKIKAQVTDFNTYFDRPSFYFYYPDSNNLIYNELLSQEDMVAQIDSIFPFYTNDFYNAYLGIAVSTEITELPGLHNLLPTFDEKAQEIKGAFSLNNKTNYWYAYYKKSEADTTTAIAIFPGHGNNQSFYIANEELDNYHNFNCIIKQKALEFGDVYMIVKPNEEFRALWKTTAPGIYQSLDYDVLGPYTDLIGKNWAANLYIEFLAQLKYLKSKYKRVLVMGLSNGGLPALVCGLEAGVDAINCASGLSVSSYNGFPVGNNENPLFSNLLNYYALDSIKKRIADSETNILFTYGSGDEGTNAYEYNYHALENYFATSQETCNADFFYNFNGHTFACSAIEPFFDKVTHSPKASVSNELPNVCTYDSVNVMVRLKGLAPFSFDLYKDSVFYVHINQVQADSILLTLKTEGFYRIKNLVDAEGYCCKAGSYKYIKPVLSDISAIVYQSTNCNSNQKNYKLSLSGIAPFNIQTNISGYENFTATDTSFLLSLLPGNHIFYSITDATGCANVINKQIEVADDTLGLQVDDAFYNCNTGKTTLSLQLKGNAPWIIDFNKDGFLYSDTVYSAFYQPEFTNGMLQILKLSEVSGCGLAMNHVFNFNYKPVKFINYTRSFNCNTGKTSLAFQLENFNNNAILVYNKTGSGLDSIAITTANSVLELNNGEYKLLYIYDSLKCRHQINQSIIIAEYPMSINSWSVEKNCANNKYKYTFNFQGKAPFSLRYNVENVFYTQEFSSQQITWEVDPGTYYMINVRDANSCVYSILRHDTLQMVSRTLVLTQTENKLIVNAPDSLLKWWFKNGVLISNTYENSLLIDGDGQYYVRVVGGSDCIAQSNTLNLSYPSNLLIFPSPAKYQINILLNEQFRDKWNYKIMSITGSTVEVQGTSLKANALVDITRLTPGLYLCVVEFIDKWRVKTKQTIKFMKTD